MLTAAAAASRPRAARRSTPCSNAPGAACNRFVDEVQRTGGRRGAGGAPPSSAAEGQVGIGWRSACPAGGGPRPPARCIHRTPTHLSRGAHHHSGPRGALLLGLGLHGRGDGCLAAEGLHGGGCDLWDASTKVQGPAGARLWGAQQGGSTMIPDRMGAALALIGAQTCGKSTMWGGGRLASGPAAGASPAAAGRRRRLRGPAATAHPGSRRHGKRTVDPHIIVPDVRTD